LIILLLYFEKRELLYQLFQRQSNYQMTDLNDIKTSEFDIAELESQINSIECVEPGEHADTPLSKNAQKRLMKKSKKDNKKQNKPDDRSENYLKTTHNPDGTTTLEVESGGFLVLRKFEEKYQFLLMIQGNRYDLPKGHRHEGEEQLAGAYRELEEETGITEADIIKLNIKPFIETYHPFYQRYKSVVTKHLVIYFGFLTNPNVKIRLTEHKNYKWIDYKSDLCVQEKTIDPLLRMLQANFAAVPK
jgi:8-oxo-dGTP pyrophosphatase MutT (NUDIX family)